MIQTKNYDNLTICISTVGMHFSRKLMKSYKTSLILKNKSRTKCLDRCIDNKIQ